MKIDLTQLSDTELRKAIERREASIEAISDTMSFRPRRTIIKSEQMKNLQSNLCKLKSEEDRRQAINRLSGKSLPSFD